jgi:hypothetical protein
MGRAGIVMVSPVPQDDRIEERRRCGLSECFHVGSHAPVGIRLIDRLAPGIALGGEPGGAASAGMIRVC